MEETARNFIKDIQSLGRGEKTQKEKFLKADKGVEFVKKKDGLLISCTSLHECLDHEMKCEADSQEYCSKDEGLSNCPAVEQWRNEQ